MPLDKPGALFDEYAAGWDEQTTYPCFPEKLTRVAAEGAPPKGGALLDVGTGTGVLIPDLLALQPGVIVACDMSREMLKQVTAKFGNEPHAHPLQVDATLLGLASGEVDVVYWNALYPHLTDKAQALREVWRVLKPGGRLVISHVMGRQRVNESHRKAGGPLFHHVLLPAKQVCETVREAGFTVLRAEDEERFYLIVAEKEASS